MLFSLFLYSPSPSRRAIARISPRHTPRRSPPAKSPYSPFPRALRAYLPPYGISPRCIAPRALARTFPPNTVASRISGYNLSMRCAILHVCFFRALFLLFSGSDFYLNGLWLKRCTPYVCVIAWSLLGPFHSYLVSFLLQLLAYIKNSLYLCAIFRAEETNK